MGRAPIYREYKPARPLRPFVHCVWTFIGCADPNPQPVAPDGRPELIVHVGEAYCERSNIGDTRQAFVLFAGQLTRPLTLVERGPAAVIGVRFHAHAARAFLGEDASIATNKRLDLAIHHGAPARQLVFASRAMGLGPDAVAGVEHYVAERLKHARVDESVRASVKDLLDGAPTRAPAGLSSRQWQRRFKAEVGISARSLQSILRFRRIFDSITHPGAESWVTAALSAGYFDQPQMVRDFRKYLGCTARNWATQKAGLARALVDDLSF